MACAAASGRVGRGVELERGEQLGLGQAEEKGGREGVVWHLLQHRAQVERLGIEVQQVGLDLLSILLGERL